MREELQSLTFEDIFLLIESRKLNEFVLPVPKELHKLVNYILTNGKIKADIFLTSGNLSLSRIIREKLDTNAPFDPTEDDVYTVAFVLMDFLATLLTPILPVHILDDVIAQYEA